jgi:hypothetical protein
MRQGMLLDIDTAAAPAPARQRAAQPPEGVRPGHRPARRRDGRGGPGRPARRRRGARARRGGPTWTQGMLFDLGPVEPAPEPGR